MLRYLRTFLAAADSASFSAAGERLGLTQSAVSLQIRRLEEDLGCQLFERTGNAVSLGPHGRRIRTDAARILDLYDGMKQDQQTAPQMASFDLGAISTVQATLLPKTLQQFRQQYPAVHVNIVPGTSVHLLTRVDSRELDLAVMIRPRLGIPADLKWISVMRERYLAVAPAGAPQDVRVLSATLPFIRYHRYSHGGHLVDKFLKTHKLWVSDGMELDEPAVILNMVREGLGWSIIPGELVRAGADARTHTFSLPGRPLLREIGALVRLSALEQPPVAAFVGCLCVQARALQDALPPD